jgi:hypothetical protein
MQLIRIIIVAHRFLVKQAVNNRSLQSSKDWQDHNVIMPQQSVCTSAEGCGSCWRCASGGHVSASASGCSCGPCRDRGTAPCCGAPGPSRRRSRSLPPACSPQAASSLAGQAPQIPAWTRRHVMAVTRNSASGAYYTPHIYDTCTDRSPSHSRLQKWCKSYLAIP